MLIFKVTTAPVIVVRQTKLQIIIYFLSPEISTGLSSEQMRSPDRVLKWFTATEIGDRKSLNAIIDILK